MVEAAKSPLACRRLFAAQREYQRSVVPVRRLALCHHISGKEHFQSVRQTKRGRFIRLDSIAAPDTGSRELKNRNQTYCVSSTLHAHSVFLYLRRPPIAAGDLPRNRYEHDPNEHHGAEPERNLRQGGRCYFQVHGRLQIR
ncbi:protein of unknown function (plasmid) [Caballeronia sp. S22]